jgi:glycosyltransferase involved in cell wall biosynthesis
LNLLIISHTEHYLKDNEVVGWGPTVSEINNLSKIFKSIYHIAVLNDKKKPPKSSTNYISKKIKFIGIPPTGGKLISQKINIILNAPKTLFRVHKILKKVDIFQFRAPTGIGIFLIPYLFYFSKKPGWFKYAGNWIEKNPPIGFWVQRFFLKNVQSSIVTVNGNWKSNPPHILSYENPCLNNIDRRIGLEIVDKKSFANPYTLCFAGAFGESKGEDLIIDAIKNCSSKNIIKEVHFIGDGDGSVELIKISKKLNLPIKFHGFIERKDVFEIFMISDFILLPSKNEGFPKVIAEASNFGCIPIVAEVSSIPQYVRDNHNGFLWDYKKEDFNTFFDRFFQNIKNNRLKEIGKNAYKIGENFTYEYYNDRIMKDILKPFIP